MTNRVKDILLTNRLIIKVNHHVVITVDLIQHIKLLLHQLLALILLPIHPTITLVSKSSLRFHLTFCPK